MRLTNRPALRVMLVLLMAFATSNAYAAGHKEEKGSGGAKSGGGAKASGTTSRTTKGKNTGAAVPQTQTGDANVRIEKQIATIKAAPTDVARADAAGGLIDALIGANMASITPQTVSDLASLLADKDNAVRYWTALALAQIGPHASTAGPALDNALRDAEKLPATDAGSPANGICLAFMRINVKPADGRCVNGEYLDAKQKAVYDASQASKPPAPAPQPAKPIAAAPATAPAATSATAPAQ